MSYAGNEYLDASESIDSISVNINDLVRWKALENQNGIQNGFDIYASDGIDISETSTVLFNVDPVDDSPTIKAGINSEILISEVKESEAWSQTFLSMKWTAIQFHGP